MFIFNTVHQCVVGKNEFAARILSYLVYLVYVPGTRYQVPAPPYILVLIVAALPLTSVLLNMTPADRLSKRGRGS